MLYVLWLLYCIYTCFVVLVHDQVLLLCYVRSLYQCPLTQGPAPCEVSFLCSISILHIWLLSLGSEWRLECRCCAITRLHACSLVQDITRTEIGHLG